MSQVPPRRPRRDVADSAPQWQIERIEREVMTAEQHDNAVTALAALIATWEPGVRSREIGNEKAA